MASIQSRLFHLLLRLINKKSFLRKQLASGRTNVFESPQPPLKIYAACRVSIREINGHNVFTLSPKNNNSGKHILYLHGGAYVHSFTKPHWEFLAVLVQNLNCTITAPDYPLAPEYTYKDSFAMVIPLYKDLLLKTRPEDLILMGDSAGGGFALALAQKMSDEQVSQPKHIILLSPWLDISLTNQAIKEIEPSDSFLGVEGLQLAGKAFAGGTNPDYYLLSPINGTLEGLGKISLFIGSKEILAADARKLKALAESKGIGINYFEYENMLHVWMLLNFPESKKARQQIFDLIRHS